jgi:hypothetical protein
VSFQLAPGTLALATARSNNSKIGEAATTYAEQRSCPSDCVFFDGGGCYAEEGPLGKFVTAPLNRAAQAVEAGPVEIAQAEADAIDDLSVVPGLPLRLHTVGDCATDEAACIVAAAAERYMERGGGPVWTYTHAWRVVARESWGTVSVLASCETGDDVRVARSRGYATAMVVEEFDLDRLYEIGSGREASRHRSGENPEVPQHAAGLSGSARGVQTFAAPASPAEGDRSRGSRPNGDDVRPGRSPRGVGTQYGPVAPERSRAIDFEDSPDRGTGGEAGSSPTASSEAAEVAAGDVSATACLDAHPGAPASLRVGQGRGRATAGRTLTTEPTGGSEVSGQPTAGLIAREPSATVRLLPCPAQTRDVPCSECRLCFNDAGLRERDVTIGFALHGVPVTIRKATAALRNPDDPDRKLSSRVLIPRFEAEFEREHGRLPTGAEVARGLGLSEGSVWEMRKSIRLGGPARPARRGRRRKRGAGTHR